MSVSDVHRELSIEYRGHGDRYRCPLPPTLTVQTKHRIWPPRSRLVRLRLPKNMKELGPLAPCAYIGLSGHIDNHIVVSIPDVITGWEGRNTSVLFLDPSGSTIAVNSLT